MDKSDQSIESIADEERVFTITESDRAQFKRLDQFLVAQMNDLSRAFIKGLYQKSLITLSQDSSFLGKLELKKMPPVGAKIVIQIPPPLPSKATPEDIPLDKLFEDEHLIIINKKAGMVVHPAPGHPRGTLVNAVLYHCPDLQGIGDTKRPGIVHRLDKGTSGVMVVAKSQKCHEGLVLLFSAHDIQRKYLALCMGTKLAERGTLKSTIGRHPHNRLKMAAHIKGGKEAITHYKTLESFGSCALMEMTLKTGRTHQIRVHLSQLLKSPIAMDPTYGRPKDHLKRLPLEANQHLKDYPHPLLHAQLLGFKHPITNRELSFESPPPPIFKQTLEILRS